LVDDSFHASPLTTRLYLRTNDQITLDNVEIQFKLEVEI